MTAITSSSSSPDPADGQDAATGPTSDRAREPLITADGRPTPRGWRRIGELLALPMPTRSFTGRGRQQFEYLTARQVAKRLDDVVGPGNWSDRYRVLSSEPWIVECTLAVCGVAKTDVGYSNAPDADPGEETEPAKAAYCVPLDAQILTRHGWKFHDEVAAYDDVLAYDLSSGLCRWTPLLAKHVYDEPHQVVRLTGKSFDMVCTPGHRWVCNRRYKGLQLRQTSQLDAHDAILLAAPAEGGEHPLTPREAAIIGWLATDGWVGEYHRPSRAVPEFRAVINQSKPFRVEELVELLGTDVTHHSRPSPSRVFPGRSVVSTAMDRHIFTLRPAFGRELMEKAGIATWSDLPNLIPHLSAESRSAMLQAMLAGDGQHSAQAIVFGTKAKAGVMQAFELLATLEGIALGKPRMSTGELPIRTLRRQTQTWAKHLKLAPALTRPVWCPTTAYGTWVVRWNDTICITGNSDSFKRAACKWAVGRWLYRDVP